MAQSNSTFRRYSPRPTIPADFVTNYDESQSRVDANPTTGGTAGGRANTRFVDVPNGTRPGQNFQGSGSEFNYVLNPSGSITVPRGNTQPGASQMPHSDPHSVTELLQRSLNANAPGGAPNQGSMLSHLQGTLEDETQRMQGAADRQYQRGANEIGDFRGVLDGLTGTITGAADQNAAGLEGVAGQNNALGDQAVSDQAARSKGVLGSLDQDLKGVEASAGRADDAANQALAYGRGAVNTAAGAAGQYDKDAQANVQNTVAGMEQRFKTQMQSINAGRNPDGTMMSPAERIAAQRQMSFDLSQQVGAVTSGLREQQSQTAANLGMHVADVTLGAGNVALGASSAFEKAGELREGAAGERARVGTDMAAQGLQAEQLRQGYRSIGAGLMTTAANMRNAARTTAMTLEMQGHTELANMIRQNPESVVSMFSGLLAMYSIATATGARNVPALQGAQR